MRSSSVRASAILAILAIVLLFSSAAEAHKKCKSPKPGKSPRRLRLPIPSPPSSPLPPPSSPMPPSPPPSPSPSPPSAPPPSPVVAGPVATGAFGSYQYDVVLSRKTFAWAQGYCNSRGGNLVSLLTQAENDYVQNLISSNNVIAKNGGGATSLWMGLKIQGGATWTDGNAQTFVPNPWTPLDGSCYNLRCDPWVNGGACTWTPAPPGYGCINVELDGFVCKTAVGSVITTFTSAFAQSSYAMVRAPGGIDWKSADLKCQTMGGRLASINSNSENLDVVAALTTAQIIVTDLDVNLISRSWIGLKFEHDYFDSIWADGTLISFNPNFVIQPTSAGSCWNFIIDRRPGNPLFWNWAYNTCTDTMPSYLCEVKGIFSL